MTIETATNHRRTSEFKATNLQPNQMTPLTIKFGLFMAFLTIFVLPLTLFTPLVIAKLFHIPFAEELFRAGNFGMVVLCVQAIGLIISLIVIAKKLKKHHMPWSSIGLRSFKAFQGIRYIAGYYLIVLGLLIVLAIIAGSLGVQPTSPPSSESNTATTLRTMGSLWSALALSVILTPIIEEIIFRGVLFSALRRRYGLVASIILSSLVFTLVHIDPIHMISALPLGIYLAVMYHKTGSIYPGIALHATWNLLLLLSTQASM